MAEQRASVRFVVDYVCSGGEVISSANIDVDNNGQCGRRYGDKGLGVSCGGKSYRTGSEAAAAAAAEQRGSVGGGADRARLCEVSLVDGVVVVSGYFFLSSSCCRSLMVIPLFVWFIW